MAKPNYGFEKRQRELAKKKKQDEKDARKRAARALAAANASNNGDDAAASAPEATAEPADTRAAPAPRIHLRTNPSDNG